MLGKILEPLAKGAFGLIDKLHLSKQEKMQFKAQMQSMMLDYQKDVQETIREKERATADIITAEVTQDDKYTKRARPTVIYVGIVLIIWGYVMVPLLNNYFNIAILVEIPDFFWHSWAAIVAVYAGGRSYEKAKKPDIGSGENGVG